MRAIRKNVFLFLSCFIFIGSAHSDDCDPRFVADQIATLETKSEFKDCKLQDMKQAYFSSSRELIQILNLLKDTYKHSLKSNYDDNQITAKMGEYGSELEMATITILAGNSIDISANNGKEQLRQWTVDVHDHSIDPKRRIETIRQNSLSSSDQLTICKVKFQWAISQKWHQRIIHCVNNATGATDNTGEASDNTTTDTAPTR